MGNDFSLCVSVFALLLWLSDKYVRPFVGKKTTTDERIKKTWHTEDFPGGPMIKTLSSQCRGSGSDACSGN